CDSPERPATMVQELFWEVKAQRKRVMALMKWDPFEGLITLRREVDRLFEDFFDGGTRRFWGRGTEPAVEGCDTTDAVVGKAQVARGQQGPDPGQHHGRYADAER